MDVRIGLQRVLRERCLNQAAIARKAGMTPMQLSDILHLRRKIEANEMFNLCDAIGIDPVELRDTTPPASAQIDRH